MDKDTNAVNTPPAAAPEKTEAPTVVTEISADETRIAELETANAKLVEESANWKLAALKYKQERKSPEFVDTNEESEEDKIRRIAKEEARKELIDEQITKNNAEKDALLKKLAKENKELKLANANKGTPPVSVGSHSESQPVSDTLITPDQLKAFQARGWTDKDIERYKKNLKKYGGR